MKIVIYDSHEKVDSLELPGDTADYDIVIQSTEKVEFPQKSRRDEPPAIPEIPLAEIPKETNKSTYKRMKDNPNSQPARIREIIYQWDVSTRKQLDRWAAEHDYSARGGGVQAALVVLDSVTEEITRKGDGDEQMIIWVGETGE